MVAVGIDSKEILRRMPVLYQASSRFGSLLLGMRRAVLFATGQEVPDGNVNT